MGEVVHINQRSDGKAQPTNSLAAVEIIRGMSEWAGEALILRSELTLEQRKAMAAEHMKIARDCFGEGDQPVWMSAIARNATIARILMAED